MQNASVASPYRFPALQPANTRPRWFTRPVVIALVLLPLPIFALAPSEYWAGAVLAYLNACIIGIASARFLKQATIQSLIPVLYMIWLGMGWVLGVLYFAMFVPEMHYKTMNDRRFNLDGMVHLQLVVMTFLGVYYGVYGLLSSKRMKFSQYAVDVRRANMLAMATLAIVVPGLLWNAINKIVGLTGLMEYIANGAQLYLAALPLVMGAVFKQLSFPLKVITLTFLAIVAGFNVIGNARGEALLPLAMFTLGFLFISGVSQKQKFLATVAGVFAFLAIIVVGDTTRVVLRDIGFGDLSTRVEALGRWQEVAAKTPILSKVFGRLYFTGGHTLVTMLPERYPYLEFDAGEYVKELVSRQLPGRFVPIPAYYSTPYLLRSYDFNITDKTSVELSFLGSLWMLGGWIPLILGSAGMALVHVAISHMLAGMARRSAYQAIFFFAMIAAAIVWGHNLDPISQTRWLVWRLAIAAMFFYLFIRPVLGGSPRPAPLPGRPLGSR